MKLKYSDPQRNIVNLANSIVKRFGVTPFHETIPEFDALLRNHERIVVMLFDGMGTALLERHLSPGALLRRQRYSTITSTFPPTTVAATNGFLSARHPIETGWLGWSQRFEEYGANIDLFNGRENITKEPRVPPEDIRAKLAYEDIMIHIKRQNPHMHVSSVWPAIVKKEGAADLPQFFTMMDGQAALIGPKFVYGYWVEPDLTSHEKGVGHPDVGRTIRAINDGVRALAAKHASTLFIVLSDHGLIDVAFEAIEHNPKIFKLLEHPFSNEPRSANFYIKKGKQRVFAKLFKKHYGDRYILLTRREIINDHWYGLGDAHPRSLDFIGDFVAVATDKYCLDHLRDGKIAHGDIKAHHAGLTSDEMLIDVIAVNRTIEKKN